MYLCVACRIMHVCCICNMGRRDLLDMYAQARGCEVSGSKCGHTYQVNSDLSVTYVCYVCNTSGTLQSS